MIAIHQHESFQGLSQLLAILPYLVVAASVAVKCDN
jgi:hypothetical protein